jgi:hypothetical protein
VFVDEGIVVHPPAGKREAGRVPADEAGAELLPDARIALEVDLDAGMGGFVLPRRLLVEVDAVAALEHPHLQVPVPRLDAFLADRMDTPGDTRGQQGAECHAPRGAAGTAGGTLPGTRSPEL